MVSGFGGCGMYVMFRGCWSVGLLRRFPAQTHTLAGHTSATRTHTLVTRRHAHSSFTRTHTHTKHKHATLSSISLAPAICFICVYCTRSTTLSTYSYTHSYPVPNTSTEHQNSLCMHRQQMAGETTIHKPSGRRSPRILVQTRQSSGSRPL